MKGSHAIREPKPKKYYPKFIHLSVRLDPITFNLLEQASIMLDIKKSRIVRSALWLTFILLDERATVRKVLKPEVLAKIEKGEDVVFMDAIKDVEALARELGIIP